MLSISYIEHSERNCYLTHLFLLQGNCQLMWGEKENIFCREEDVVNNKNLEDVTV